MAEQITTNKAVPIAPGLFSYPAEAPVLLGSRCGDCGEHFFPAQAACSRCSSENMQPVELGDRGVLWSWTVQGFCPKAPFYGSDSPESFKPYGVGYVQMPCGLKVEARLLEADPELLTIGAEMKLVLEPLYINEANEQVLGFAFTVAASVAGSADGGAS